MSQTAHLLTEARALIERGWTQGASARNKSGHVVAAIAVRAVCWCPLGAIRRVTYGLHHAASLELDLRHRVSHAIPDAEPDWTDGLCTYPKSIAGWNDKQATTQDDVLSAFTKAIHAAEQEATV